MDPQIIQKRLAKNMRGLQESYFHEEIFWQKITDGIPIHNIDNLKCVWIEMIKRSSRINLGLIEVLKDLTKTHKLTLLSNTTQLYIYSPFNDILDKIFAEKIYSCEVGFKNPRLKYLI